jgi:hypothetical protein
MTIEVLYFRGCPNHRPAVDRLRSVLKQEGLSADVLEIEVKDENAARALKFIGSPTLRVNGLDIEMNARTVEEAPFACRRYVGGLPPEEMIRSALREGQMVRGE